MRRDEYRYCDQGCGYRLPPEYGETETTCGACLDEGSCLNCGTTDETDDIEGRLCAACFAAMTPDEWHGVGKWTPAR